MEGWQGIIFRQDSSLILSSSDSIPESIRQDSILTTVQDTVSKQDTTLPAFSFDTLSGINRDSISGGLVQDTVNQQDSVQKTQKFSTEEATRVLEKSEQKNREVDSLTTSHSIKTYSAGKRQKEKNTEFTPDSSNIVIAIGKYQNVDKLPFTDIKKEITQIKKPDNDLFIKPANTEKSDVSKLNTEKPSTISTTNNFRDETPAFWNDWVLGIIILGFVLLGWIKIFYNKFILETFRSTYNNTVSNNLFLNRNVLTKRAFLLMNLVFYINTGLFLFLVSKHFNISPFPYKGIINFLLFTAFIMAAFFVRYIISKIVGFVATAKKIFSEYLHNIFIYTKVTGLVLLPLLIIIPYTRNTLSTIAIFTGLCIISVAYLMRIIRGIKIFVSENVSPLYLFLYLCTFEFLPILVFLKYFEIL